MRLQRVFNYFLNNLLHAWVLQYCNNLQIIVVLHTSPLIPLGMLGSGKCYKQANNLTFYHTYFEGQALVVLQINTPVMQEKELHSTCPYSEEQWDYSLPSPADQSTSNPFLPALTRHHCLKVFRNQLLKLLTRFLFIFAAVLP